MTPLQTAADFMVRILHCDGFATCFTVDFLFFPRALLGDPIGPDEDGRRYLTRV